MVASILGDVGNKLEALRMVRKERGQWGLVPEQGARQLEDDGFCLVRSGGGRPPRPEHMEARAAAMNRRAAAQLMGEAAAGAATVNPAATEEAAAAASQSGGPFSAVQT
jgi:hypothetical protein